MTAATLAPRIRMACPADLAVIVEFGSGFVFPWMSTPVMFTIRVNLPTRSKKIARLWYVPSSSKLIGHSACICLVTTGAGLNPLIVRFD